MSKREILISERFIDNLFVYRDWSNYSINEFYDDLMIGKWECEIKEHCDYYYYEDFNKQDLIDLIYDVCDISGLCVTNENMIEEKGNCTRVGNTWYKDVY